MEEWKGLGVNSGFNRNIVECKVVIMLQNQPHLAVLIETLWNVKSTTCSAS